MFVKKCQITVADFKFICEMGVYENNYVYSVS